MSPTEAPAVTSRPADRDETYSISLSQTTTTGFIDWDVENVIDWLHFIQLQHLMPIFRERAISGAKLNGITQKELQFIGIVNADEQQTILHEVGVSVCAISNHFMTLYRWLSLECYGKLSQKQDHS